MSKVKVIKSGNILEVFAYDNINQHPPTFDKTGVENGSGATHEETYKNTIKSRQRNIRSLINTNFDVKHSKFVTLTFNNKNDIDIRNPLETNKKLSRFLDRLKRRFDDLKYLWVIEFQDTKGRGAVHYHMICNIPYVKSKELEELWGHGFVKINSIDKVDNIGVYVTSYMTQDMDDERLHCKRAYGYSNNLIKPTILKSWTMSRHGRKELEEMIMDYKEKDTAPYTMSYINEHLGNCSYTQYNCKRNYKKRQ